MAVRGLRCGVVVLERNREEEVVVVVKAGEEEGREGYVASVEGILLLVVRETLAVEARYSATHLFAAMMEGCDDSEGV